MRQDELICPSCSKDYTQSNPPRLLTMCGHTFCHTCIKVMIVKKKDGKFKLKCPSDKISIDLQTSNPGYFPKNMILLDVISKRRRHSRISFHGGGLKFAKKPAQHDGQDINEFLPTDRRNSDDSNKENEDHKQQNMCRLHENPLDIVCLVDRAKICFECALFGLHKGHKFSSIKEEEGEKSSFYKEILTIIQQKQAIEMRLSNQEIKDEILGLFKKKQEQTIGIVRYHYRKLEDEIKRAQKQLIAEIMNYFSQNQTELHNLTSLNEEAKLVFKIWEDNAFSELKKMEQKGRRATIQGDIRDKQKYIIANGQNIITKMKNQQQLLIQNVEDIVQTLTIHTRPQVIDQIQTYCTIKIQKIESKKADESVLNDNEHDCSLLLEEQSKKQIACEKSQEANFLEQESKYMQREKQQAQKSESDHEELLTTEEGQATNLSFLCQTQSQGPKLIEVKPRSTLNASMIARTQTPAHKVSVVKPRSNSVVSATSNNSSEGGFKSKMAQKASLKSKAQQKYESALNGIQNGTIEVIDLYNSEIGNDLLKDLFKKVKSSSHSKVRSLRMVKNNLNDDSAQLAIETLDKVNFLSLAQNNYSDKFIKQLVQFVKNKNYLIAKTVLLGQNRITERKVKESFEELKKHNITVIL